MNGQLMTLNQMMETMKQNNNSFKTKEMKKIFDILFKDKEPEKQPLKLEIKLKSTATPDEKLDQNEWFRHIHDSLKKSR